MFETAILRKHGQSFTSIDRGLIAETLLFYSNVHLIVHFGVLIDLLKEMGPASLIRLIDNGMLTLTYLHTDYGTATVTQNGIEFHAFVAMHLSGTATRKKLSAKDNINIAFERAIGKSTKTRHLAKKLLDRIKILPEIGVPGQPNGVPGLANSDLDDGLFLQTATRHSLIELVPSYTPPIGFRFEIIRSESGFIIDHNSILNW